MMVQQTHKSSNPAIALKTIELIDRLVEAAQTQAQQSKDQYMKVDGKELPFR